MSAIEHLSFQLYSARNFPPLDAQLSLLAELGYQQVEPFGGLYANLPELAEGLRRHGLRAPSGHIDLATLEGDVGRARDIAGALGTSLVVAPYLQPADRPSDAGGWRALGTRLAKVRAALQPLGLRLAWHNHDFELQPLPDGSAPLDLMLAADPELAWEADVGWITRAGADPVAWIERYGSRIAALHVKDVAAAGAATTEDGWADVGAGTLDWNGIIAAARQAGVSLFIVEHDNPSDLRRCAGAAVTAARGWAGF